MTDLAIRVDNLSKLYHIGALQQRHDTLRDALTSRFRRPNQSTTSHSTPSDELWALRDVCFEVKRGEVVGIIGRNGAGKSTLLKILSRITEPTSGLAEIHGRVGSLLEVGTGFHPELTGRENIYLNGAILGMKRTEIDRQFDEIVAFAEIERFLDTPVKRYSSGMYVRLAFAVAAHLEPEILLVDEVLAVGDAAFQKKCLGKMGDVAKEGRTVLFVSHNMGAIRNLCQFSILLSNGYLTLATETEVAIRTYLGLEKSRSGSWIRSNPADGFSGVFIERVSITDDSGSITDSLDCRQPFTLNVMLDARGESVAYTHIHARLTNEEGVPVFTTANTDSPLSGSIDGPGLYEFQVRIPGEFLRPGSYSLVVASMLPKTKLYDIVQDEIRFSVEDIGSHATVLRDARLGVVTPVFTWENVSRDESA